ncbi:hypothetical protein BDV23DRAFT_35107 [Aspergillus alliaceus]|uniref:Uncharacterized protein n=1 Tax=Petromyces alliaceus TaxID=209559 RepID=A0A5N7BRZ1_PETAA|nr:hypothetical protein BDV23DRAFT_35107 [Aspergillus alliaceus]
MPRTMEILGVSKVLITPERTISIEIPTVKESLHEGSKELWLWMFPACSYGTFLLLQAACLLGVQVVDVTQRWHSSISLQDAKSHAAPCQGLLENLGSDLWYDPLTIMYIARTARKKLGRNAIPLYLS